MHFNYWNLCSSQHKRQQTKKVSPDRRPTNSHFQSNGDEDTEPENALADGVSSLNQGTTPDDEDVDVDSHIAIEHINDNPLKHLTVSEEMTPLVISYCNILPMR